MALMSMIPTADEFKKWLRKYHPVGKPSFTTKEYRFTGFGNKNVHNSSAALYPKELAMTSKSSDLNNEILRSFNAYLLSHQYIPIMNNPGANAIKLNRYYEHAYNYCKNARKKEPDMLARGWRGFDADKKPKRGAHLSSSWVRGAKQKSENRISLNLGGKMYDYAITNFDSFMHAPSIGRIVAMLRRMPAGSSYNGLKKLY